MPGRAWTRLKISGSQPAALPHPAMTNPDFLAPLAPRGWAAVAMALVGLLLSACDKPAPATGGAGAGAPPVSLETLRLEAGRGDARAQVALGLRLLEGREARPDYAEAARLFRLAGDQGSAEAQFHLAGLYEAGRGVARDEAEAVRWNRRAAEAGHAEAQYALALLYALGRGTPKDKPESVKWFRAAAEQGLTEAQFNLAQRYQHGQGVDLNLAEAYKWFALAAKQGLPDAAKECRQLKTTLTPEQIAEGDRFAAAFTPGKPAAGTPARP